MRQFDVCRNPNAATRGTIPYLIVMQSNLHRDLRTRVVAPLFLDAHIADAGALTPSFVIEKAKLRLNPTLMSVVQLKSLGDVVTNLEEQRYQLVRAIDVLFTGT